MKDYWLRIENNRFDVIKHSKLLIVLEVLARNLFSVNDVPNSERDKVHRFIYFGACLKYEAYEAYTHAKRVLVLNGLITMAVCFFLFCVLPIYSIKANPVLVLGGLICVLLSSIRFVLFFKGRKVIFRQDSRVDEDTLIYQFTLVYELFKLINFSELADYAHPTIQNIQIRVKKRLVALARLIIPLSTPTQEFGDDSEEMKQLSQLRSSMDRIIDISIILGIFRTSLCDDSVAGRKRLAKLLKSEAFVDAEKSAVIA